jgi:leucine-rich repeat-containing G protein-coupled receptor 8
LSQRQCFTVAAFCDFHTDCLDGTDENNCGDYLRVTSSLDFIRFRNNITSATNNRTSTSVVITLDGRGYFTHTPIHENVTCPDTHFRCLGRSRYCLPVYTRCNSFNDCLDGEDERGCEAASCPGFYRCRGSACACTRTSCVTAGRSVRSVTTSGCVENNPALTVVCVRVWPLSAARFSRPGVSHS